MNKRLLIFIAVLAVILIGFGSWFFLRNNRNTETTGTSNASNDTTASTKKLTDRDLSGDNDILIVYFSRTEGIYNGPLEIGNTARIANFIQEATGADTYEIIPEDDYPDDYEATADQAREEQENDARPAIAGTLPDVTDYETIFIGAPIWWGEYPMIVRTFLDAEADALADKTLVPFTTHLGSGLGNTQRQLESQFSDATVLDGFSVNGDEAADAQEDVNDWLNEIGVSK